MEVLSQLPLMFGSLSWSILVLQIWDETWMSRNPPWPATWAVCGIQVHGNPSRAARHPYVTCLHRFRPTPVFLTSWSSFHGSVCIRDAKEAFSVRPRFPEKFTYMVLDVEDNEEQNLIRLFPTWATLNVPKRNIVALHFASFLCAGQRHSLMLQLPRMGGFSSTAMVSPIIDGLDVRSIHTIYKGA